MQDFCLYCKSYSVDVFRAKRLAASIAKFNVDRIPFVVSCPEGDKPLFESELQGFDLILVCDEDIVRANPRHNVEHINSIPGHISQQIVKSEFWRLGLSRTYLCLDSDCQFTRPFRKAEFIDEEGNPYTIMDEARELLIPALALKKNKVIDNFLRESAEIQQEIQRPGKVYNFGPNCPVWDARVWQSLDENLLQPRNLSFAELIVSFPNEMRWYGESVLKFGAIRIRPSQPFFKMYHYAWQLRMDRRLGITEAMLSRLYCGVVYQSAWERQLDWPSEGGKLASKIGRRIRMYLGRI
jgi:hypothetical protein